MKCWNATAMNSGGEALSRWIDRKVVTYLKENHSRFEAILSEQSRLAEKYPVITPFLDGEGAMELTAEEHQAIKRYLNLREDSEFLIREHHYYLGQAMNIPGLEEFGIHWDGEQEAGENRTSLLLDLLAGNKIEEANQIRKAMALQEAMQGNAKIKRNSWSRGNGSCSAEENSVEESEKIKKY